MNLNEIQITNNLKDTKNFKKVIARNELNKIKDINNSSYIINTLPRGNQHVGEIVIKELHISS
jgi:hypothetical protein